VLWVPIVWHTMPPVFTKLTPTVTIAACQEYYPNQIEFNIPWCKPACRKVDAFLKYLNTNYNSLWYDLFMNRYAPEFVWVHTHMILKNERWIINKNLKYKKFKIFQMLLDEYLDIFPKLIEKTIAKNTTSNKVVEHMIHIEMYRLINNHNILIYFDKHFFDMELDRTKRWMLRVWYHMTNGSDKPKYQPVIRSLPRWTKPLTLEVRWIPNFLWLNTNWLRRFFAKMELTLNAKYVEYQEDNIKGDILIKRQKLLNVMNEFRRFWVGATELGRTGQVLTFNRYMQIKDNLFKGVI